MSVIYLYGFVPDGAGLPDGGLLGVGDAVAEVVPLDGFGAAIARLDPSVYGAEALEARTGDVEWMAEQGLRHEQVVAWFVDTRAIVPARLLTLFSSVDALRNAADADRQRILRSLERFETLREWDLKVEYDAARMAERLGQVSETVADLDRQIAEAGPGKRFLLERKRRDIARDEARAAARRLGRELLDALRPIAEEVAVIPPPSDRAPVVLNAALLIPRDREADALETVQEQTLRLEPFGLGARFTGPWAPYRFLGGDDG